MTKEKFTYELIDNWLYLISQQCVLMENYTQKDRTAVYADCCDKLSKCFDYYEQVYKKVDLNLHSEEEVDARLGFLIQRLRNETIKNIISEIEKKLCAGIKNEKEFMNQHLLQGKHGAKGEITKDALIQFVTELRLQEERTEGER